MELTLTEQEKYGAIIDAVQSYLHILSPDLQAITQPYVTALSRRSFIQMMSLLPDWVTDLLPVAPEVSHRLGLAHFYTCWYYHAQDDLLDAETPAATLLGGHLALLKLVDLYSELGVTGTPCWAEFQQLTRTSAQTYALELSTRFKTPGELTPAQLAVWTVEFAGDRVAPFYFNTLAQAHLAGFPVHDPHPQALMAALHCFMAARQIGDDAADWLDDWKAGQLNYVSAHLVRRFQTQGGRDLNLEGLAAYQLRTETFWTEIERTTTDLHHQALAHLVPYGDCYLRPRLIEFQITQQAEGWASLRRQRGHWREVFGVKSE
jgi:hypothetical protein